MDKVTKSLGTFSALVQEDNAEEGSVRCVVSTFNIVDKEGDVVLPGAIKDGTEVRLCAWGHKWEDLPVGKGVIRCTNNEAIFEGKFFLTTEAGRETYQTVKELGALQEWSWGFRVVNSHMGNVEGKKVRFISETEPFEVSPVLIGANQKTRTLFIKSEKDLEDLSVDISSASVSSSATSSTPIILTETLSGDSKTFIEEGSTVSNGYLYTTPTIDYSTDTSEKSTTIITISEEGSETVYDMGEVESPMEDAGEMGEEPMDDATCCSNILDMVRMLIISEVNNPNPSAWAIEALACAWKDIESYRFTVLSRMADSIYQMNGDRIESAKQLREKFLNSIKSLDALIGDTSEFKTNNTENSENGIKYVEEGENLLAGVSHFVERTKAISELRLKEGRKISSANVNRLMTITETLKSLITEIEGLVSSSLPASTVDESPAASDSSKSDSDSVENSVINEDTVENNDGANAEDLNAKQRLLDTKLLMAKFDRNHKLRG